MDHDDEEITSGTYLGIVPFFNDHFHNYPIASFEELDEFIEGKYEETYRSESKLNAS